MQIRRVMQLLEQICIDQEFTQMTPEEEKYLLDKELLRDLSSQIPFEYLALGQKGVAQYHDYLRTHLAALRQKETDLLTRKRELVGYSGDPIIVVNIEEAIQLERQATDISRTVYVLDETRSDLAGSFFTPSKRPVRFGRDAYLFNSSETRPLIARSCVDYDLFLKYNFSIIPAAEKFGVDLAIRAHDLVMRVIKSREEKYECGGTNDSDYPKYISDVAELLSNGQKPAITYVSKVISIGVPGSECDGDDFEIISRARLEISSAVRATERIECTGSAQSCERCRRNVCYEEREV